MRKIIITAANGFMGSHLVKALESKFEVVCLVRQPQINHGNVRYILWDGKTLGAWIAEFDNAYCIINLAGRTVDCRYTEKNMAEIYTSRLESTKILGEAIRACKVKPDLWINAASATIYRHSLDTPMTEIDGEYGTGFSVDVCQKWEGVFFEYKALETRQVALRTAIVLGEDGGAFIPLLNLVKYGFGGKQGPGNQMFSWIHIEDFCDAVKYIIENNKIQGAVNVSAPTPVANNVLMKKIRTVFNKRIGIPLPTFLLKLGAVIIKTETELILKSRYVIPQKLIDSGFQFQFNEIEEAIIDIKRKM